MFGLFRTIRNRKRNEAAFTKYGDEISQHELFGQKLRVTYASERDVCLNIFIGKVTCTGATVFTMTDSEGNQRDILYRHILRIEGML